MKKTVKIILAVVLILLVAVLGVSCYLGKSKYYFIQSSWKGDCRIRLSSASHQVDQGKLTGDVKDFEGFNTIWYEDAESDHEVRFDYDMKFDSGLLKLVLITEDGSIHVLLDEKSPMESAGTQLNVPVKKGHNEIKLIGYKVKGLLYQITSEEGQFHSLGDFSDDFVIK